MSTDDVSASGSQDEGFRPEVIVPPWKDPDRRRYRNAEEVRGVVRDLAEQQVVVAARPVATITDMGVASPSAQGQAMISTATALIRPKTQPCSGPNRPQPKKVSSATDTTVTTK